MCADLCPPSTRWDTSTRIHDERAGCGSAGDKGIRGAPGLRGARDRRSKRVVSGPPRGLRRDMPRKKKPTAAAATKAADAAAAAEAGPAAEAPEEAAAPDAEAAGAEPASQDDGNASAAAEAEAPAEAAAPAETESAPADSADAASAETEAPPLDDAATAEAGAGSKRSAESKDGEQVSSPDRPKKQKKSGWDSQETPTGTSTPSGESATPGRARRDGPPPREGDWVRAAASVWPHRSRPCCHHYTHARARVQHARPAHMLTPHGRTHADVSKLRDQLL
jgi:hypothetical protein